VIRGKSFIDLGKYTVLFLELGTSPGGEFFCLFYPLGHAASENHSLNCRISFCSFQYVARSNRSKPGFLKLSVVYFTTGDIVSPKALRTPVVANGMDWGVHPVV